MVITTYTCILILAPHISSESSLDFFSEPRDEALHSLTILVLERNAGVQGGNFKCLVRSWSVLSVARWPEWYVWCGGHTSSSDTQAGCPLLDAATSTSYTYQACMCIQERRKEKSMRRRRQVGPERGRGPARAQAWRGV